MPELNFHVEIPVTRRAYRGVFAALLLGGLAGDLASESVTLTTYYPAPSGAYAQLIATQASIFSRDAQSAPNAGQTSYLAVGTSASPANANLTATKLAVMNGYVGIGTLSPAFQLHVIGQGSNNIDFAINGRIMMVDPTNGATNGGGLCLNNTSPCTMMVGQVPSNANVIPANTNVGIMNGPAGQPSSWRLTMSNSGNVGIGLDPSSPLYPLSPKTPLDVNGPVNISGCGNGTPPAATPYPAGTVSCAVGTYATYLPGVMSQYQTGGDASSSFTGHMFCCPCTGGTCPLLP